ncbi:MAG: alkaline phosphatase family protein [bacterium]
MKRRTFIKLTGLTALAASSSLAAVRRLLSPLRALAAPGQGGAPGQGSVRRVVCLGLDGMDPGLLDQYMKQGVMPNFSRLVAMGDFKACGTSIPPQSPVAWSNFITGQNPGGHAIYDFIHRDPDTLMPMLSISKASSPEKFLRLGGWKLPRSSGSISLLRRGRAFWEYLADADIDTTVFKMPSNFPPVDCDVRSISGMGTPDILGTYGMFSYYTTEPPENTDIGGGRIIPIQLREDRFTADIFGPANIYRKDDPDTKAAFEAAVDPENPSVRFSAGDETFILQEGEWSDWITVEFNLIPHLKSITGICRFYLMQVRPTFRLYVSPVQIDPSNPEMPICTPPDYSREIVENVGPFYTQGLPDDTKALDEGIFGDADYISQANVVLDERMKQYRYELDRFRSIDRGFLFFYFNSLDQNCHMFWRNMDPESPMHDELAAKFAHRIRDMYIAMDTVLEEALGAVDDHTVLFVVSDHGFAPYRRSFHVNTWLYQNGYLNLTPGSRPEDVVFLNNVDWRRTKAYALGLNGLYLNRKGRETRGIVARGEEEKRLLGELVAALEAAVDAETGERPIKHAYRADEVYTGPYAADAPDIILGYARGYRGSNESALGEIAETIFSDNVLKWSGDHCMAADEVPGVLLCNRKFKKDDPSLLDMAPTFLSLFGLTAAPEMSGRDIFAG